MYKYQFQNEQMNKNENKNKGMVIRKKVNIPLSEEATKQQLIIFFLFLKYFSPMLKEMKGNQTNHFCFSQNCQSF